jgi:hypothetical protein
MPPALRLGWWALPFPDWGFDTRLRRYSTREGGTFRSTRGNQTRLCCPVPKRRDGAWTALDTRRARAVPGRLACAGCGLRLAPGARFAV